VCTSRVCDVHTLVIEGNPGMLSAPEIAQRFQALSELKIHPRDHMENRTLLARGERLYQQLRGDERERLGREIARFEQALGTQERRMIVPAIDVFRQVLDYFDHQSFLLPEA
jgi:molecular chaperone HscC